MNDAAAHSQLSQLLDAMLDLPLAQRATWIESLDATLDPVKPRLRALLSRAAEIEARDFLGSLPPLPPDDGDQEPATLSTEAAGARVGPYRLERPLGAGGMATVWLASRADGMFERQVALKLPHRGMFGVDLAERMTRERSILASLEHPHIARLYEAGLTEDGQPYLALEYVEGQPIDAWCRAHASDLRSRVRLLVQVADAVASAHARLVVHRDLKPANILVTREGYVRLLDFGIAKLLDPAAAAVAPGLTQLSVHALTPDYAAPEQILGEPVTIAADVYSLGVVLFELLTGEKPYRLRRDTRGALEEAILQAEPRRPSEISASHARALRGDLDTIVLKALHKKPADRYATVNALAEDLRRHLDGRPVLARPDNAWYRASRFVRRNRLAVTAASLVAVALIVAVVIASVGLVQARAAERRALAEAETTRQVSRFMVELFNVSDPGEARGNSITAREILDKASARVTQELSTAPGIRAELLATMADVYAKLGLYAEALKLALPALDLRRANASGSIELANSLDQVGEIYSLQAHGAQATPLHQEALSLRRALEPSNYSATAKSLQNIAVSYYVRGDFDATLRALFEARAELARDPRPPPRQLGELLKYTANLYHEKGDYEHAIPAYREALAMLRAALGADHPSVAGALGDLAVALKDTRQFDEAEQAYLDSLAIKRRVLGPRHPEVGNALNNLAVMYLDIGKNEQALATAQEGTEILRGALGDDHEKTNIVRLNAARAQMQVGNLEAAESELRAILAIRKRTLTSGNIALGITMDALADVLNHLQKFNEALTLARDAVSATEQAVGRDHWRWAGANRTLGAALTGLKRYSEAEPILLASYELMRAKRGEKNRTTVLNAQRLVDLYQARGDAAGVKLWQQKIDDARK